MTKIHDLLDIMRCLRHPENGCPWDLEQTFDSIVPHTIEETYEVADCIERQALEDLPGELGDLLFQIVFYAELGREQGRFDFDDIVSVLIRKLTLRHPHVFGDAAPGDAHEQTRRWEAHKAGERKAAANTGGTLSELDGVPLGLPALTRAKKLQQRAARVGFDWPDTTGVKQKVLEEFQEVETAVKHGSTHEVEEEIGDLLFACVNWVRHLGLEPETALRAANAKFERRFHFIEQALADAGTTVTDASFSRMDELWESAKFGERQPKEIADKKTGA